MVPRGYRTDRKHVPNAPKQVRFGQAHAFRRSCCASRVKNRQITVEVALHQRQEPAPSHGSVASSTRAFQKREAGIRPGYLPCSSGMLLRENQYFAVGVRNNLG